MSKPSIRCVIRGQIASSSRLRSTRPRVPRASSATATQTLQRFLASRPRRRNAHRRNPSRQPRPAQGLRHRHLLGRRNWNSLNPSQFPLPGREVSSRKMRMERTAMAAAPRSAIVCARSSASTSSTPNWSRPTPSNSAAPRRSERPAGNKSRTSSHNWPTAAEKDRNALLCQLNSYRSQAGRGPHEPQSPRPR